MIAVAAALAALAGATGAAADPQVRALVSEVRAVEARVVEQRTRVETMEQAGRVTVTMPGDVLFAFDSARLSAPGRAAVGAAARALTARGADGVVVEGHTDARGSDAYNLRLARRRARAVATRLARRMAGVRIAVRAYGERRPVASNAGERGRARNRRVELRPRS